MHYTKLGNFSRSNYVLQVLRLQRKHTLCLFTSGKQIKCVVHALLMSIILIPKKYVYQIAFIRETVLKQLVFTCLLGLCLSVYFSVNVRMVI